VREPHTVYEAQTTFTCPTPDGTVAWMLVGRCTACELPVFMVNVSSDEHVRAEASSEWMPLPVHFAVTADV
jgi:hypothetical protein